MRPRKKRVLSNSARADLWNRSCTRSPVFGVVKSDCFHIDDWKPYQVALEYGVEVVSSLVYIVRLYRQDRISVERVLDALAKMTRRGTIKPEWIYAALEMVALIRETRRVKGDK
jgi:hypothetical protein